MTNYERSIAYREALRNYAEASLRTTSHVDAFTALLVAERILAVHVDFDPGLAEYREACVP